MSHRGSSLRVLAIMLASSGDRQTIPKGEAGLSFRMSLFEAKLARAGARGAGAASFVAPEALVGLRQIAARR